MCVWGDCKVAHVCQCRPGDGKIKVMAIDEKKMGMDGELKRKLYGYLLGLFIEIAVSAFYAVLKFILVK